MLLTVRLLLTGQGGLTILAIPYTTIRDHQPVLTTVLARIYISMKPMAAYSM